MLMLYIKLIAGALIISLIGGGYWYVSHLKKDLDDTKTALVQETMNRLQAEHQQASLVKQIEEVAVMAQQIHGELKHFQNQAAEQKGVFDRHDFNMLLQKKPGLIAKRMQRKTVELFDLLQDAVNDD